MGISKNKKVLIKDHKGLSPNEMLFVEHLLASPGFDMAEAAKRAGYKSSHAVSRLLSNGAVRAALAKGINRHIHEIRVSAEQVLNELAKIAFFNPKKCLNEKGSLMELKDIPDDVACVIRSMKVKERTDEDGEVTRYVDLEFWNKMDALTCLMRHFGLEAPKNMNLKVDHDVHFDWTKLYQPVPDDDGVIEAEVLAAAAATTTLGPVPGPISPGPMALPAPNGNGKAKG